MNILDKIIEHKKAEVAERKKTVPVEVLRQNGIFSRDTFSLKAFLLDESRTGIIAEFKRRSPSKGVINDRADVLDVTQAYTKFGASGLSVLTDGEFFGGSAADLQKARTNAIPLLRKDFIIDEYQLTESRAMGADAILLIASCLSPVRVKELASFARELRLEVLLEIHGQDELEHICSETELIGVNNRDLKTFSVDISRSVHLGRMIPSDKIRIAESGIDSIEAVREFREAGFRGLLVGEYFMKQEDPSRAFEQFVSKLKAPYEH